jgi:hypothetical protein
VMDRLGQLAKTLVWVLLCGSSDNVGS